MGLGVIRDTEQGCSAEESRGWEDRWEDREQDLDA